MPRNPLEKFQVDPKEEAERLERQQHRAEQQKAQVVTFRGIPDTLHRSIKRVAAEHKITVGEVARLFLTRSLEAYERGDLTISTVVDPESVRYRVEL